MASFWQWRFPAKRTKDDLGQVHKSYGDLEVERVTWLCGDERILVEEAVDLIKAQLGRLHELEVISAAVGVTPQADIWASINQYIYNEKIHRLIIIRSAQLITDWAPLELWLWNLRTQPNTFLVLVSDEPNFAYVKTINPGQRQLQPHLKAIQERGDLILCSSPPRTNGGDMLKMWIESFIQLEPSISKYLIERSGADLLLIRDTCWKLRLTGVNPVTEALIDQLCVVQPRDSFVGAVFKGDQAMAYLALEQLPLDDYRHVIDRLDRGLDWLAKMKLETSHGKEAGRFLAGAHIPAAFIEDLKNHAKNYDPVTVNSCRAVLRDTDHVLRSGFAVQPGVMESLVLTWPR